MFAADVTRRSYVALGNAAETSVNQIFDISNKSVNIKSENCLDIRLKSQLRGVNPSLWIRPFISSKPHLSGP
jgi:hypothetical protein